MTSLAAWLGVDQRTPSSLYLVADSRFTALPSGDVTSGQKTFASATSPDCFSFCGDVLLPSRILRDMETAGLSPRALAADRHAALVERVRHVLGEALGRPSGPFTILHGARDGVSMAATFYMWRTSWIPESGLSDVSESLPTTSVLALAQGSGRAPVEREHVAWSKSDAGRTSRAVFSSFCDAIRSGADPLTGGPPQIAALYRTGPAEAVGVIWDGRCHLRGSPLEAPAVEEAGVEWRNELFERCDPTTLQRLPSAQRHARPKLSGRQDR